VTKTKPRDLSALQAHGSEWYAALLPIALRMAGKRSRHHANTIAHDATVDTISLITPEDSSDMIEAKLWMLVRRHYTAGQIQQCRYPTATDMAITPDLIPEDQSTLPGDLPDYVYGLIASDPQPRETLTSRLKRETYDAKLAHLAQLLSTGNGLVEAARIMGISRCTAWRYLAKLRDRMAIMTNN
jgi:hypothetical protein